VTAALIVVALIAGIGIGAGFLILRRRREEAIAPNPPRQIERILLPFTGPSISLRALDAALRLARAENATLVPAYVATVPMTLPPEAPIPEQADVALAMLEAIEQRACAAEVPVDSRVERGRTLRDALRKLMAEESFERMLVPVSGAAEPGFTAEDIAWVLEHAPTEVVAFRSAPDAERLRAANGGNRATPTPRLANSPHPSAVVGSSSA
jgi:nucleotide-binding universal stress UspA family protein